MNINLIFDLKIFQRHAGLECRQSVMAQQASSQFYSDNKSVSEYQFPGRRLSSFISLKTIALYSNPLSVPDSFVMSVDNVIAINDELTI